MAVACRTWLLFVSISTLLLLSCILAEECDNASAYKCPNCYNFHRCDGFDDECVDCGPCRVGFVSTTEPGAGHSPCSTLCQRLVEGAGRVAEALCRLPSCITLTFRFGAEALVPRATTTVAPRRTMEWPELPNEGQPPPDNVKAINTKTFITGIVRVVVVWERRLPMAVACQRLPLPSSLLWATSSFPSSAPCNRRPLNLARCRQSLPWACLWPAT